MCNHINPNHPKWSGGVVQRESVTDSAGTTSENFAEVLCLIEIGNVIWNDADIAKTMRDALRLQSRKGNHQEIARNRKKSRNDAPSARLTPGERARIPQIRLELAHHGITLERWELRALVRGAPVNYDGQMFSYFLQDD
ncbi:Uncharacterised protein [Serratia grimesii]|nr:Uncharacterised protein [Serratia grimesii]